MRYVFATLFFIAPMGIQASEIASLPDDPSAYVERWIYSGFFFVGSDGGVTGTVSHVERSHMISLWLEQDGTTGGKADLKAQPGRIGTEQYLGEFDAGTPLTLRFLVHRTQDTFFSGLAGLDGRDHVAAFTWFTDGIYTTEVRFSEIGWDSIDEEDGPGVFDFSFLLTNVYDPPPENGPTTPGIPLPGSLVLLLGGLLSLGVVRPFTRDGRG